MVNQKLQFLNISWNYISADSINDITEVIQKNQNLEKIAMQHNRLGEGSFTRLAKVISTHKSLTYIDISQNLLKNAEFVELFSAVQSDTCKMATFHCRKNMIGGDKIDRVLNCHSKHLCRIDFSQNKLTETNGQTLLTYTKANVWIEELLLDKNIQISAQVINNITLECQKNILIKKKIMAQLP